MSDELIVIPGAKEAEIPFTVVQKSATSIAVAHRIVRFRGRAMIMVEQPFPHFTPLHKESFDRIAYPLLGGVSRSRMNDTFSYLHNTVEDLTKYEHLILFGLTEADESGSGNVNLSKEGLTSVWDMDAVTMSPQPPALCVWRSPYAKIPPKRVDGVRVKLPFVMQLAGNDEDLYDDIMQSMAPLLMTRKPDGVIWWVGDGANGKSTLMDALYKIFPGQFSSLTVKRLTDGRDTPSLNGTLANIVKESSEGRIDDTEIYKAIGTHENFRVHKFHSQDDIEIRGNLHHIFSANTIPTFNDKGYSARRRTFIIPFAERFDSDPLFEEKTFTPEFFGHLIQELSIYAARIKEQGYRYKWSAKTLAAKADYDVEASNAEEYGRHLIDQGCVAFDSFNPVRMDYENWCAEQGYVPLGIGNLRRALMALGFERLTIRSLSGNTAKHYRLPNFDKHELQSMGMGVPGMYTVSGFAKAAPPIDTTVPDMAAEEPKAKSILKGKW